MTPALSLRSPIVLVSSIVFAIVLAVAASAQFGFAEPSAPSGGSVFIPIEPVRILDTRENLGLEGGFESASPRDLQVTGGVPTNVGEYTIPTTASAIAANVTIVRPTARGYVSVRPGGAEGTPETANLNFAEGDVVPNKVDVKLGPDGAIQIWFQGASPDATADIIVDVVGFYSEHDHDDRYYTQSQVNSKIAGVNEGVEGNDSDIAANAGAIETNAGAIDELEATVSSSKVIVIDESYEATSYLEEGVELVSGLDLNLVCYGGATPQPHIGWNSGTTGVDVWSGTDTNVATDTWNTIWQNSDRNGFDVQIVGVFDGVLVRAEIGVVAWSDGANDCSYRGSVTVTTGEASS